MTNSISSGSRSKLLGAVVVACAVLGVVGDARADRKRVVVLDFEGPRADKFHDDLVKLIKKTHTVVPTDKWNGTAEELDAGTVSERNVKKVARKLKVDAIVEGKIEKRRDEFIIRLRLREGKSGGFVGASVDTKAEGPRIDGRAQRDIKDELLGAIDNVASSWAAAGDDEEDERPARKPKKLADDEDERPAKKPTKKTEEDDERPAKKPTKKADDEDERPAKKPMKKADDDDERPVKKGFSRRSSDDERGSDRVDHKAKADDDDKLPPRKTAKAEDDKPAKKPAKKVEDDEDSLPPRKPATKKTEDDKPVVKLAAKPASDDDDALPPRKATKATASRDDKPRKKVAARDDDDATEVEADAAPLDAATSLSPGERALDAVAGLSFTIRRMTFAYRRDLLAKPAGYSSPPAPGGMIDVTFYPGAYGHHRTDVLKNIGLNLTYDRVFKINSQDPMTRVVYPSLESRWGIAGVYRYSLTQAAVIAGTLGYTSQLFRITGTIDTPSVKYSIISPGVALRYQITPKILAGLDARFLLVTSAGGIQATSSYGDSKVLGYEGGLAVDYQLTRSIFARAQARYESIAHTFTGNGAQTTMRDGDPMTQDVSGAKDSYIGFGVTAGYLY